MKTGRQQPLRLSDGLTRWRRRELLAWIKDGAPQPASDWVWRTTFPLGVYEQELNRLVAQIRKAEKKLSAFCERIREAEQILDNRRAAPAVSW